MRINRLQVKNFRSYSEYFWEFDGSKVLIVGSNASGKTTLIEAIYMLGLAKSPRTAYDSELIKNNESSFFVEGDFESSTLNKYKVSLGFDGEKRLIKKNQTVVKKLSDHIGLIDCVWFSSFDLNMLTGNPQIRRRNFDRIICQISKVYFAALSNYKKFLKERNALLKRLIFENKTELKVLLETIDQSLVNEGKKIISLRRKIINKLNQFLIDKQHEIGNVNEDLKIEYIENVKEEDFLIKLKDSFLDDLKHGNTSFGPHKDDYIFIINNKNIVYQGSQGQQRNAILSLKLSEVDLIYEVKKEYPILLLDDVFSELDRERQNKLLNSINKEIQTIITTTSLSEIDNKLVEDSMVIEVKGDK